MQLGQNDDATALLSITRSRLTDIRSKAQSCSGAKLCLAPKKKKMEKMCFLVPPGSVCS